MGVGSIATKTRRIRALADLARLGSTACVLRFLEQILDLGPESLPRLSFLVRELLQSLGFRTPARSVSSCQCRSVWAIAPLVWGGSEWRSLNHVPSSDFSQLRACWRSLAWVAASGAGSSIALSLPARAAAQAGRTRRPRKPRAGAGDSA